VDTVINLRVFKCQGIYGLAVQLLVLKKGSGRPIFSSLFS
jgi:hypothetical protein